MKRMTLLAVAVLLTAFGVAPVQAQSPVKIRIAWVVPVANSPTILFERPELLKHKGKTYEIDLIRFQGTPPMIQALGAGELDIALFAYSSFALAVQNAGMTDLRVIADEAQEGIEGYYSSPFMVLKDGPVKKVADMKGRIAATVGAGAAVDIALRAQLKKAGLEDKRDYTLVEAGFPNMRAMLAEKKIDLASLAQPFSLDPELLKIADTLFTVKDALGGQAQFVIWAARAGFLEKNKAAVNDMMEDALRTLRFYMDQKNRATLVEVAMRVGKLPAAAYQRMYTKDDLYRDPNFIPNMAALQRAIDVQQEVGFLKAKLDVKPLADLSFVEEANKRLK